MSRTSRKPGVLSWVKHFFDALISILILAPLVVSYWRGTFLLLDLYLLPSWPLVSVGVSLGIALFGGLIFNYSQNWMKTYADNMESPVAEIMLKRVYCYVSGLVVVNHWRGIWALWDIYTGTKLTSGALCFGTGVTFLLILRCYRNTISPPMVAACDLNNNDDFFTIQTRFRVPESQKILFFLDNVFSLVVPASLVVCNCRGLWMILDHMLWMPNYTHSLLTSCGIGAGLVFIVLLLQKPAATFSRLLDNRGRWFLKLCFEDLYMFLATSAGVNMWRGIWGLCNEFVFPTDLPLSSWICHGVGMGGLMLLFHGSSALIKGFQIDGEFSDGKGCWLPSRSLTIFDHQMLPKKRTPAKLQSVDGLHVDCQLARNENVAEQETLIGLNADDDSKFRVAVRLSRSRFEPHIHYIDSTATLDVHEPTKGGNDHDLKDDRRRADLRELSMKLSTDDESRH